MPPTEPGPSERFSIFAPDVPPTDPTAALRTAAAEAVHQVNAAWTADEGDNDCGHGSEPSQCEEAADAVLALASQADDPSGPDVPHAEQMFDPSSPDFGDSTENRHRSDTLGPCLACQHRAAIRASDRPHR